MPEYLPVRKCINAMVGITRSKVFFFLKDFSFNTRGKLRNPIFGNFLIALYKEIELILRLFFFLKDFSFNTRGKLRNPIFVKIFQLPVFDFLGGGSKYSNYLFFFKWPASNITPT